MVVHAVIVDADNEVRQHLVVRVSLVALRPLQPVSRVGAHRIRNRIAPAPSKPSLHPQGDASSLVRQRHGAVGNVARYCTTCVSPANRSA
jgi:hypothetical protein